MQLTVKTKDILNALARLLKVVEKSNVKAILNNIKLSVVNNRLSLVATNLEILMSNTIVVDAKKEGETTVNAILFNNIVRKVLDDEIILLFLEETEQLLIKGKNFKFKIATTNAKNFPNFDQTIANIQKEFYISSRDLLEILEVNSFSMALDKIRYNLNGVYLHSNENNEITIAATDCHRLSLAKTDIHTEKFGVILSKKTFEELTKLAKYSLDEMIHVTLNNHLIKFSINNLFLISKLVDGVFPDYNHFIPKKNENKLTIKAKILFEVVDRISTITPDDKLKAVKISINSEKIEVSSYSNINKDYANEVIVLSDNNAEFVTSKNIKKKKEGVEEKKFDLIVGLNPAYLLDVLRCIHNHEVEIAFADENVAPILLSCRKNDYYKFVIMPIRV